jgi:hypothetical protein
MFLRRLFGKRDLQATDLRTQVSWPGAAGTATRTLAPYLVETIVDDDDRALTWDELASLGGNSDQLFALAREQAAACANDVKATLVADYVQVMASSGSYLGAYLLESFRREPRRHGVLFVPVSRHHWCVHALQRLSTPPLVALMHVVADDVAALMRVNGGALPRELYWYKPGGAIEKVAVTGSGTGLRATTPELERTFDRVLDG